EASKKFTPDQQLIFDAESSDLRWFLLPSEAKQYIFDENVETKKAVFTVRNSFKDSHSNLINENNILHTVTFNSAQDVNCNFADSGSFFSEDIIPVNKTSNCCEMTCLLTKENVPVIRQENAMSNAQLCKWYSPSSIIFKPFLK
ncbi:tRNA-cytidine(32) 2-sulfurtransferase, partial [Nephila pilipes]